MFLCKLCLTAKKSEDNKNKKIRRINELLKQTEEFNKIMEEIFKDFCFFLAKKIKNYTSFCRQFVIANRVA